MNEDHEKITKDSLTAIYNIIHAGCPDNMNLGLWTAHILSNLCAINTLYYEKIYRPALLDEFFKNVTKIVNAHNDEPFFKDEK